MAIGLRKNLFVAAIEERMKEKEERQEERFGREVFWRLDEISTKENI